VKKIMVDTNKFEELLAGDFQQAKSYLIDIICQLPDANILALFEKIRETPRLQEAYIASIQSIVLSDLDKKEQAELFAKLTAAGADGREEVLLTAWKQIRARKSKDIKKLWGGNVRRIEVYNQNRPQERLSTFLADDAISLSPRNIFYLRGEEVYWYDERQCFYKSFEIKE